MSLDAATYFQHLRAYVNSRYIVHDGEGGEVILKEKYFQGDETRARTRKIALGLSGLGMAFKLDHDQVELQRKKAKPPLFHFLDDNAKAWSKRCDFVVFRTQGRSFFAARLSITPATAVQSGSANSSSARMKIRVPMSMAMANSTLIPRSAITTSMR